MVQTSIFLLVVNSTHLKTIISDLLHCLNSTRSTLQLFVSYLYNVRVSSIQAYKSSNNEGYNNTSISKLHKQLHNTYIWLLDMLINSRLYQCLIVRHAVQPLMKRMLGKCL